MRDEKLRDYLGVEEKDGKIRRNEYRYDGIIIKIKVLIDFVKSLTTKLGYEYTEYENDLKLKQYYDHSEPSLKDLQNQMRNIEKNIGLIFDYLKVGISYEPPKTKLIPLKELKNGKEKVYL